MSPTIRPPHHHCFSALLCEGPMQHPVSLEVMWDQNLRFWMNLEIRKHDTKNAFLGPGYRRKSPPVFVRQGFKRNLSKAEQPKHKWSTSNPSTAEIFDCPRVTAIHLLARTSRSPITHKIQLVLTSIPRGKRFFWAAYGIALRVVQVT